MNQIATDRLALWNGLFNEVGLHFFSDPSEKCLASCVFVVSCDTEGNLKSCLVTEKSKVFLLKIQSIP